MLYCQNCFSLILFGSLYLSVLPVLIWAASFPPLLPVITCLMQARCVWYLQGMPTGLAAEMPVSSSEPGFPVKSAWHTQCVSGHKEGLWDLQFKWFSSADQWWKFWCKGPGPRCSGSWTASDWHLKTSVHVLGRHQDLDSRPLIDCVCTTIESFKLKEPLKDCKVPCNEQGCLWLDKVA